MKPSVRKRVRKLLAVALGMVASLVLVELLLTVSYKAFVAYQDQQNHAAGLAEREDEIRILCIGESTTAVAGDPGGRLLVPHTSYPAQLERILNERQSQVRYRVFNSGMMAGTTDTVMGMLGPSMTAYDPDIIIAMMGIKDDSDPSEATVATAPSPVPRLRTLQLIAWATEAVRLRRQAAVLTADTLDDVADGLRPRPYQLTKFIKEIELLRSSADRSALDDLNLALFHWYGDRHVQAAAVLRRTIAAHDLGHMLLGRVLVTNGKLDEAEQVMRAAVTAHPDNGIYRVGLAEILLDGGRLDDAETALNDADDHEALFQERALTAGFSSLARARLARERGDHPAAVAILEAMELDFATEQRGRNFFPNVRMLRGMAIGESYLEVGRFEDAEHSLLEALELRPRSHSTMWTLSKVYRAQGRRDDEEALRRTLLGRAGRMAEYHELAKLYRLHGEQDRIDDLFEEALLRIPSIRANHARLYQVAADADIALVVMQYPSFSLETLHKYAPPAEGVHFIDNEHVFDADPEHYFFEPRFPNSFSHYTAEGSRLLAEHVADTVLVVSGAAQGDALAPAP
jgi:tetratricopeptide (TPR) repeat protein